MAYTYKGQEMRKWVPVLGIALSLTLIVLVVVLIVRHKPVPRDYYAERPPITQPNGTIVVQEPDHSWFYYYMLQQMNRPVQPTFTTRPYVPPAPARVTYGPSYPSTAPASNSRTSGGFSGSYSAPSSSRSTGGFSSPKSYSAPKSYSSPSSSSSSKTSGGFSSSKPSSSRTSGGFSKSKGGK